MAKLQGFYYKHLSKQEQGVYDTMLAGFTAVSPGFRILYLGKRMGDIFFMLRLDHPEIFYVKGCSYRGAVGAEYVEMIPEYMFEKSRVKEQQNAVEARLKKLLRPVEGKSEAEKEKYIHDFICQNVRYDKLKKPYSHEVIGPLQNGVGVCEGIAKTVKIMCDRLGLECMIAISHASEQSGYLHAWNVIKIGGKYCHLDATFDNSLGRYGGIRYDYYNLDDKRIFRDHRPLKYPAPPCTDGDMFYYRQQKMSFTKYEDVANRVSQALRKKKEEYLFHWRGGYLTKEVFLELCGLITETAAERGKSVSFSVNFPQAVIKLSFDDEGKATGVETEIADEAEEGEIL